MSKNFKLFLGFTYLLLLAVFLYFIFSNIQINRLNDFSYYKELQLSLDNFISSNFLINIIYFFIFAIILGCLTRFWITNFNFFRNFIWQMDWHNSFSYINFYWSLALYSIANFFFRDIVKNILEQKFQKYIQLFQKNEFYYFFIYRFIGGLGSSIFFTKCFSSFI